MTKRQQQLATQLLHLLDKQSVQEWNALLSLVDDRITTRQISSFKRALKKSLASEHLRIRRTSTPVNRLQQIEENLEIIDPQLKETDDLLKEVDLRGRSVKAKKPSGQEYSKWLRIIGGLDSPRNAAPQPSKSEPSRVSKKSANKTGVPIKRRSSIH